MFRQISTTCFRGGCSTPTSRIRVIYLSSTRAKSFSDEIDDMATKEIPVESHLKYSFKADFYAPKAVDVYSVQPGGYVDITKADIKKYFPEGLAGDAASEFDFTGRSTWMVRDATKLLCGLLEEYEEDASKRLGIQFSVQSNRAKPRFGHSVDIENLTSRPEWPGSLLRVQLSGEDLVNVLPEEKPLKAAPVLVEEEGSLVEKCIQKIKLAEKFPTKILLTGDRGSGKSVALSQMVYQARKRGWICFFIPNGWEHVQQGPFVQPVVNNMGEKKFDNALLSVAALRGFSMAHSNVLQEIPIKKIENLKKYKSFLDKNMSAWKQAKSVPGRDKLSFVEMRSIVEDEDNFPSEDDKDRAILAKYNFMGSKLENLGDLVLLGIAFRDLAGLVVMDVIEDLRELESIHPVLLAVDHINTWSVPASFQFENTKLMPNSLCIPHALNFISKKKAENDSFTLKNGLCVGAVSFKHNEANKTNYYDAKNSIPLSIRVPNYSKVEFFSTVLYYSEQNRLGSDHSTNDILALRTYCGSNPRLLRLEGNGFLLPIYEDEFDENLTDPRDVPVNDISAENADYAYEMHDKDFDLKLGGDSAIK